MKRQAKNQREKTNNRLIKIVLAIGMLLLLIPMTAFADSDEHQHIRSLQRIVTAADENDVTYCGEFYCKECQSSFTDSVTPEDLGMPIIDIQGSLDGISKTNKVTAAIAYSSDDLTFESDATFKVQGSSSSGYPKKNYSIQFIKDSGKKNKIKLVEAWGSQSKYCLKANYVDYSQSRNVVSGRLFNQIVHSRNINDEINSLNNGGVVDGYPVAVFYNGEYLGLYTMNIPKDKWMFGMDDETKRQALLFGDSWTNSVRLKEAIADVNNVAGSGWDLEYCSTEDNAEVGTAWAAESMNDFIAFLNSNDGEDFKNGIANYTNVDRAIDVLIFTYFIHAGDNTSKNIMWATYDGVKWIPSVYDMDGTWGMVWNGSISYSAKDFPPSGGNVLFKRLLDNYPEKVKERYVELRKKILSQSNIEKQFALFFGDIHPLMYTAESEKWTGVPSQSTNNYDQIINYARERVAYLDSYYGVAVSEAEDPFYRVSFNAPTGTKVFAYETQDYSQTPVVTRVAFSRTKEGKLTVNDGQTNFLIAPPKGYVVDEVTVSPSDGFKNLKGKEETGQDKTYRITKINKDINVNIEVKKHIDHVPSGDTLYTWSDDYSSCTANDVCGTCGLELSETAASDYSLEKEASCSEEGLEKYSVHFSNDGFEDQQKEIVIEKGEHAWKEPVWAWLKDKEGAYAIFICENNPDHINAIEAEVNATVTEPANGKDGKTVYTATVPAEKSPDGKAYQTEETVTIKDTHKHIWDEGIVNVRATTRSAGVRLQRCKICNTAKKVAIKKVALKSVTVNKKVVSAASVKRIIANVEKNGGSTDTIVIGKKVKKIKARAFRGAGIKRLIVKTRKLKGRSVRGALKGSKVRIVKVKVGGKKANKKYVKKYKKIFTKKNAGRKVKVI